MVWDKAAELPDRYGKIVGLRDCMENFDRMLWKLGFMKNLVLIVAAHLDRACREWPVHRENGGMEHQTGHYFQKNSKKKQ